jgi:hypothetical protein
MDVVSCGFTLRLSVITESHPAAEISVALCEPAAVNVSPFQTSGNWAEQILESIDVVSCGFTLRLSVITESHPVELVNVVE